MSNIYIEHNPYRVETIFQINGEAPADTCRLADYKNKRIQHWVENIFSNLQEIFNGEDTFDIHFKGVESDFMDLKESAEIAEQNGMTITLNWTPAREAEERFTEISALMDEALQHTDFKNYLDADDQLKEEFFASTNNDFDVYVIATMSAGKSTLLNAMLGQDILPAANEATTATITQIFDDKNQNKNFKAACYGNTNNLLEKNEAISIDTMQEWNASPDISWIKLEGNISAISERENVRLVLTDTPGPNNSQDTEHARITMSYIQDSQKNPLILYVLNATQLGTNDDKNLLSLVAEQMQAGGKQSKDRFIFVVNKMDAFDPEKGEDVEQALENVKKYLIENGIEDPAVYPVSAMLTRLLRKHPDTMSRTERGNKNTLEELFVEEDCMDLTQYMPLNTKVRNALKNKEFYMAELRSGLPAVECMIDEYIYKYNFPNRVARAHATLQGMLEKGLKIASMVNELQNNEQQLERLREELSVLHDRASNGFDANSYKESIRREGKELPDETQEFLDKQQSRIQQKLNEFPAYFDDPEASTRAAKQTINTISRELEFLTNSLINDYQNAFSASQKLVKENLQKEYVNYVAQLFPDSKDLVLPILEDLKKTIASISLNLGLSSKDVKEKDVVTGYRTVKDSKWYNPFSWGRTREVAVYSTEEYVDLPKLWRKKRAEIMEHFTDIMNNAREKIIEDKETLVASYLDFFDHEFSEKFNALLAELEQLTQDEKLRYQAIEKAQTRLAEIKQFQRKIDRILEL